MPPEPLGSSWNMSGQILLNFEKYQKYHIFHNFLKNIRILYGTFFTLKVYRLTWELDRSTRRDLLLGLKIFSAKVIDNFPRYSNLRNKSS